MRRVGGVDGLGSWVWLGFGETKRGEREGGGGGRFEMI